MLKCFNSTIRVGQVQINNPFASANITGFSAILKMSPEDLFPSKRGGGGGGGYKKEMTSMKEIVTDILREGLINLINSMLSSKHHI